MPKKVQKNVEVESEVDVSDIDEDDVTGSDPEDSVDSAESEDLETSEQSIVEKKKTVNKKNTKEMLKRKITDWLDLDDKIKELAKKSKELKDKKKSNEEFIMKMINALKIDDQQIAVDNRGKVYKYKSVTKSPIKEDTIKSAMMELFQDEKKVNQIIKKIEGRREVNERYYLKRTKGNKKD